MYETKPFKAERTHSRFLELGTGNWEMNCNYGDFSYVETCWLSKEEINKYISCLFFLGQKCSTNTILPPLPLLKVVASWINQTPDLCLMTLPSTLLTAGRLRGSFLPPESTPLPSGPLLGLLRWAVLMPLARDFSVSGRQAQHESRLLCSQLHLAIIQAFLLASKNEENPQEEMELEPGEVMDESDSRHLIKASDLKELSQDMIKLIDNSRALELNKAVIDQQVQLSIDRFAQTLQVAMATSCLSATKGKLM